MASPSVSNLFAQGSNQTNLLPKESAPYGASYEEHIKNYWKLMLSLPIDQNPMEDTTGVKCTNGQDLSNASVFYFSGGFGGLAERTCKIPAGLGVFIPIITVEASLAESPKSTIQDLHQIAKNDQDHVTSLYLKINDKEYLTKNFANSGHTLKNLTSIFLLMLYLEHQRVLLLQ